MDHAYAVCVAISFQIHAALGTFVCGVGRQNMKGTLRFALIMVCGVQSTTRDGAMLKLLLLANN